MADAPNSNREERGTSQTPPECANGKKPRKKTSRTKLKKKTGRTSKKRSAYVSVTITKNLAEMIDAVYEQRGFSSRAEFVKYATRKYLESDPYAEFEMNTEG